MYTRSARRRLRLTAAVLPVLLAAPLLAAPSVAAPASAAPLAAAAPAPMEARSADSFVEAVGVDTHFRYEDTAYGDSDAVLEKLEGLGVRHIRDGFPLQPTPETIAALKQLPALGIKAQLVLGTPDLRRGLPLPPGGDTLAAVEAAGLRDVVESFEAPNEWNLRGGPDWVAELQRFMGELYTAVRSDPQWNGVPVVGPSVGRKKAILELKGFEATTDIANLHNYASGRPPEDELEMELDRARAVAPGKPLYVTETGYHVALNQEGRQAPVSERAHSAYLTRTLLENFRAGVDRTYIYQLLDNRPDPAAEDQEQFFGLVRNDYSERPAYAAVSSLLTTLADPGPAFEPEPLDVAVTAGEGVMSQLLQKRDGSYLMVLWRRGVLFEGGQDVSGSAPVSLSFGDQSRQVGVNQLAAAPARLGRATEVKGVVGDTPLIVEIGAQAAAASSPSVVDFGTAGAAPEVPPSVGATPQPSLPAAPPVAAPPTSSWSGVLVGAIAGAGGLAALLGLGALALRARRRREEREREELLDAPRELHDDLRS